jgi:fructose-1,6-bisphosphatase/inositol monophosphatase family enzyme
MSKYQVALDAAIDAAREAGALLRAELHRSGGPRGSGGHAELDEQAERVIRQKVLSAFPAAYLGEETGSASSGDQEHVWLVDPNDGTAAYLKGNMSERVRRAAADDIRVTSRPRERPQNVRPFEVASANEF